MRFRTTKQWIRWWNKREIDWKKDYLDSWNHEHRNLIITVLKQFRFASLMEAGCASGPNLARIRKEWPKLQVGGTDIAEDAIKLAKQAFPDGIFDTKSVDDMFFSDNTVDVSLTDMTLIYVEPRRIRKALNELKRVTRNKIVLCEFHHKSWWKRQALRLATGYNAYDYGKLLEREGFYDIQIIKIPEEAWPGGEPQKTFGYIMTATVPPTVL